MVKVAAAELEQENKTAYHVEAVTPRIPFGFAFVKRASDILVSLLVATLGFLPMLVIAVLIKLDSKGPVIFKQERLGKDGKPFTMYKFRSMCTCAEQNGPQWAEKDDDRCTRVGRILRKTRLDELPQFWNILKGDMSLVGPRPEVPYYVEQFKDDVPLYMVKHQVRPGITGWAQVNGFRGDTSIKGRIDHDIYYIEHWSLLLDIKILFMTVFGGKFMNSESLSK
jgi:exopolysaccharide biosynthesis polyprenyl glycosylphosphotransferase